MLYEKNEHVYPIKKDVETRIKWFMIFSEYFETFPLIKENY